MVETYVGVFLSFYIYCFLKQIQTFTGCYKEKATFKNNQILVTFHHLEHLIY